MRRVAWLVAAACGIAAAPAFADGEAPAAPAPVSDMPFAAPAATHAAPAATVVHHTAPVTHAAAPLATQKPAAALATPAAQKPSTAAATAPATATANVNAAAEPAPPAAAPVVAAAPTPAPAPAAANAPTGVSPSWLRADKPVAKRPLEMQQGPSPLRVGGMLLLVAGLGGAAWYAKKKRQGATSPAAQKKAELRVIGTTRVGAKASAVVVEVGGKRLLLGVTDQNVSTLAWLDDEANAAVDDAHETSGPNDRLHGAYAPDDVAAAGPSGFLKLLRNAVGSSPAAQRATQNNLRKPAPVDEVVQATRDEVRISRRQQPEEPVAFEGQVMGLAKRRKETP